MKCVVVASIILIAATVLAKAADPQTPVRDLSGRHCADKDAACLRAVYDEYKGMLREEFTNWRSFEPRIRTLIETRNSRGAKELLEVAIAGGWYRHNKWVKPDFQRIEGIGVPPFETFGVRECRPAILSVKHMLIDIGAGDFAAAAKTLKPYLESAAECEEVLKLPPVQHGFPRPKLEPSLLR